MRHVTLVDLRYAADFLTRGAGGAAHLTETLADTVRRLPSRLSPAGAPWQVDTRSLDTWALGHARFRAAHRNGAVGA